MKPIKKNSQQWQTPRLDDRSGSFLTVADYPPSDYRIVARLIAGAVPVEFQSTEEYISETGAHHWAAIIFMQAREQLYGWFAPGAPTEQSGAKADNPNTYKLPEVKGGYKYPLTQGLSELGWERWQATVNHPLIAGKKANYTRYAVHFWVSPLGELALGKLPLAGKYDPEYF